MLPPIEFGGYAGSIWQWGTASGTSCIPCKTSCPREPGYMLYYPHGAPVAATGTCSTISDRTCTKITFASAIGLKTFKWAGSGINNANSCADLCSSGTYLNVADGAAGCASETRGTYGSNSVDFIDVAEQEAFCRYTSSSSARHCLLTDLLFAF